MQRYVAFLRAINVGGRVAKMDALRKAFESLGYSNVETLLASGNVLFESAVRSEGKLQTQIENALRKSLGYEVATFVRSSADIAAIASHPAFDTAEFTAGASQYIAFFQDPPTTQSRRQIMTCVTAVDDFRFRGSEMYWLCRKRFSESTFSGAMLERTIGGPATVRNTTTVQRIAAMFAAGNGSR
jgi:uncharacterized protein (DUF1697 family)